MRRGSVLAVSSPKVSYNPTNEKIDPEELDWLGDAWSQVTRLQIE